MNKLDRLRERVLNDASLQERLFAETDPDAFVRRIIELAPECTAKEVTDAISKGRRDVLRQCRL